MQPYLDHDNLTLYCGDLRDVLPTLPESSVDFVVTDPPYLLNFMEKEWDKAGDGDIPTSQLVFRSWFAGLVAGEACFRIHREKDGAYYGCEFSIKMRADEGPLLRALARRIGAGTVQDVPAECRIVNSGPAVKWIVYSREDCWKIAHLLDGTLLYAKKQREYDVWRRALSVWTDRPRGNRWKGPGDNSAMEALWNEMKTLRPFDQDLAESHFDPLGQPAYLFHYQWAKACLRVVKPGGLLLAFGGTRTYHRMICAIEDAGWEIRDSLLRLFAQDARINDLWESLTGEQRKLFADLVAPGQVLAWLQGQGFPKAADVGKMIDKARGAKREVVGTKVGLPGYSLADNGRTNEVYGDLHNPEAECAITAPATPEAARWTGFANALKPAWEPLTLAMKPMDGTIAHNALTHGVAGMNIDATRIGDNPGYKYNADRNGTIFHGKQGERIKRTAAKKGSAVIESTKGRWPGNLLLDEHSADLLDAQTGTLKSGTGVVRTKAGDGYHGGMGKAGDAQVAYGDSGGASRFFKVIPCQDLSHNRGSVNGMEAGEAASLLRFKYCGKATTKERGEGNDHSTVKPVKLMEYLLTLLSTPDGGVILDPFAGSGSTLLAAQRLGRRCIGVELTEHNCNIIRERLHVSC